jgi:nitroreductase
MQLGKAIKSRKSVRDFSKKKPDWRDVIESIDAARFAPMSGDNYSLKFILIDEKDKIQKISEASQQEFIQNAQYLIVVCSNPKRTINAYGPKGNHYLRQQAGAAMENLILALQDHGLSTCWIGHFVDEEIKRLLNIPEEVQLEALFPVGYEGKKSRTKEVKIELDQILYFNKYGNKKMKVPKRIDT